MRDTALQDRSVRDSRDHVLGRGGLLTQALQLTSLDAGLSAVLAR
jgi:hypothetical protein